MPRFDPFFDPHSLLIGYIEPPLFGVQMTHSDHLQLFEQNVQIRLQFSTTLKIRLSIDYNKKNHRKHYRNKKNHSTMVFFIIQTIYNISTYMYVHVRDKS